MNNIKNQEINVNLCTNYAPYPKVTGAHCPNTVKLLKEDYAGVVSELTAITQYIFQENSLDDYPSFQKSLLKIAIQEMKHLDLLGEAIETLGGSPRFDDGEYYWVSSNVDYSTGIKNIVLADIKAEKAAIENYTKHAQIIENKSVKDLINRIIEDEKLHLEFYENVLQLLE